MSKNKSVSGKTHTKQQLDDYANQNNPNNKAYKARKTNEVRQKKQKGKPYVNVYWVPDLGLGWCDD